jgi:hypothetical protein
MDTSNQMKCLFITTFKHKDQRKSVVYSHNRIQTHPQSINKYAHIAVAASAILHAWNNRHYIL